MPGVKTRGGIASENQEELVLIAECGQRVDGVGGSNALNLAFVDLDALRPLHCETAHRHAMLICCDATLGFLPRITRRHHQDPVQVQLVSSALRGVEVGDMDGVEGPTEDSNAHGDEHRDAVA